MIYFAPLQGFTDYVYRKAYSDIFRGVDAFYIPYITLKNGDINAKHRREILPENNLQDRVVPQVLVKDAKELISAAILLKDYGYKEINLNLGCPYSMVTRRGKGAGLLQHPEKIDEMLSDYFSNCDQELSVKLRVGLDSNIRFEELISVLNGFPLKELILHPRLAKQLYSGDILTQSFQLAGKMLKHKLVYNGDINSLSDFQKRKEQFPNTKDWMLGRGILMNPFLPSELNGETFSDADRKNKLLEFHDLVFESYLKIMDNEGNALNKMKQFWHYFSFNFTQQKKAFKLVKKSNNTLKYRAVVANLFAEFY